MVGLGVLTAAEQVAAYLRTDLERIGRMSKTSEADACVVVSGSNTLLRWFSERPVAVFALFGRRRGLPIAGAGPDKPSAYAGVTRRLVKLGHRRIVLLNRRIRRMPEPGASERAFLAELAAHGITPGLYHLPDWEESIHGFNQRLDALFRVTPPTALIIDEVPLYFATLQFCANRGLRVVGWAANVSRGKTDVRQTEIPVEFVEGGTIGRVGRA